MESVKTVSVDTNLLYTIIVNLLKGSDKTICNSGTYNKADPTYYENCESYIWVEHSPCPTRKLPPPIRENYKTLNEYMRELTAYKDDYPLDDFFKIKMSDATWGVEFTISNHNNEIVFYFDRSDGISQCNCNRGEAFKDWTVNNCFQKTIYLLLDSFFIDEFIADKYETQRKLTKENKTEPTFYFTGSDAGPSEVIYENYDCDF